MKRDDFIDMTRKKSGVPLIDVGEVGDLLGIDFFQFGRNAETIHTRVFEHTGGAVEFIGDGFRSAMAAKLPFRRPFCAPKAAKVAPNNLAAMDAEVSRFPVWRLRETTFFADGAHRLAQSPDATPEIFFLGFRHGSEPRRDLILCNAFSFEVDCQIELAHGDELRATVSTEPAGAAGAAPIAGQDGLGLLATGDTEVAAFVVFGLLGSAVNAVNGIWGFHDNLGSSVSGAAKGVAEGPFEDGLGGSFLQVGDQPAEGGHITHGFEVVSRVDADI